MTGVEQLGDEQDGDHERQLRMAMGDLAIGVATELAVVGEPRDRPFHGPATSNGRFDGGPAPARSASTHSRNDELGDAEISDVSAHDAVVTPTRPFESESPGE